MTEVHGLPEPPEGCEVRFEVAHFGDLMLSGGKWCECVVASTAHAVVVARRKWKPEYGDPIRYNGSKCYYLGNLAEFGSEDKWVIAIYSQELDKISRVKRDEIVGPWVDPEPETPAEPTPSNAGTTCDSPDGPCACGAWHSEDVQPEPLQVGDRVRVLPKGGDPLELWRGREYQHEGDVGTFSSIYKAHHRVRFNGDEETWTYSRCQLEKLPAEPEKPAIDPIKNGDFVTLEEPATIDPGLCEWTTPGWAKGLGWMGQDRNDWDNVYFFTRLRCLMTRMACGCRKVVIGACRSTSQNLSTSTRRTGPTCQRASGLSTFLET